MKITVKILTIIIKISVTLYSDLDWITS